MTVRRYGNNLARLTKKEIYPIIYRCHDLERKTPRAQRLCARMLASNACIATALQAAAAHIEETFAEADRPFIDRAERMSRRLRKLSTIVATACQSGRTLPRGVVAQTLRHTTRFMNAALLARCRCVLARETLMQLRLAKVACGISRRG